MQVEHEGGNGGVQRDTGGASAKKRAGTEGKKDDGVVGEWKSNYNQSI